MPVLSDTLDLISSMIGTPKFGEVLQDEWGKITPQTIDYGIMEHAEKVAVLPAKGLGWSDVGSWDSLFDFLKSDEQGNVILGNNNYLMDVNNTLVNNIDPKHLVALIGIDDLVIVESKDVLLVCKRGDSQHVRKMVEILKKKNLDNYL
jgi:mannose-1-phosphate guanylyltransferase